MVFHRELEPLAEFRGGGVNADALLPGPEIEDIASALALAETVPTILGNTHSELSGIGSSVNRTTTAQAVAAAFHPLEQAVVLKHLLHRDGGFDGLEVNVLGFGHGNAPFNEPGVNCGRLGVSRVLIHWAS
jgi:hypothetical protein